jgi:hypothetical protein
MIATRLTSEIVINIEKHVDITLNHLKIAYDYISNILNQKGQNLKISQSFYEFKKSLTAL